MAFVNAAVGALDKDGNRLDKTDKDGNRKPFMIKVGPNMKAAVDDSGSITIVEIDSTLGEVAEISGTAQTNSGAVVTVALFSFDAVNQQCANLAARIAAVSSSHNGYPISFDAGAACDGPIGSVTWTGSGGAPPVAPYAEITNNGLDVVLKLHGDSTTMAWSYRVTWELADIVGS